MKSKCRVLLTIVLFMMCQMVCGQTIVDRSNMTIGKIGSDGTVYDRSNMTVGRFKSDGYIVDRNNMTIGRIKSDSYTLNGIRLQGAPTQQGVYIRNGKKMIVK